MARTVFDTFNMLKLQVELEELSADFGRWGDRRIGEFRFQVSGFRFQGSWACRK